MLCSAARGDIKDWGMLVKITPYGLDSALQKTLMSPKENKLRFWSCGVQPARILGLLGARLR